MPLTTHFAEDVLEAYSLGRLSDKEASGLEEHLLVCHSCQERLERTDDFVRAFRIAVHGQPRPAKPSWLGWLKGNWRPLPVAGAVAMAALALALLAPRRAVLEGETTVSLVALRGSGGDAAPAPAHRRLHLDLDATALPGQAYRIELADSRGRVLWRPGRDTPVEGTRVKATVSDSLGAGIYWVRLYDPGSGQLAREFGLRVR